MVALPVPDDTGTRLAVLASVADQLTSSLDVHEHLGVLPRLLVPYLGEFVIVSALDADGAIADVGSWHVDPRRREAVERYSGLRADAGEAETLGARVIRTGRPIVVDSGVEERTRTGMKPGLARDLLLELAPRAVALLPMLARGRTVGLLSAFAPAPFTPAQLGTAHDVAARAALAIDNALAYERADAARALAEESADRMALLAAVGEAVAGTDDPDEAVGRIARLVVPALADWSTAVVLDEHGGLRDVGWAHRDPALADVVAAYAAEQSATMAPSSPLATCLRTGEVVRTPVVPPDLLDRAVRGGRGRELLHELTATSAVSIPLVARGRTFGALSLVATAARGRLSDDDVAAAVEVVRRATPVVDSARSSREVQRVAESMQRNLLTVGATPAHLQIRSRYRPAHADRRVGGDWYDAFGPPGGGAVVAIGDVMGHDVAAIAAMAQLRTYVRAFAWSGGTSPSGVLTATDAASNGLGPAVYATAVVAAFGEPDPAGRVRVRWSNAGHLPPAVLAPDGTVRLLDAPLPDVPLGVAPERARHDQDLLLEPGSVLVLFTDGLVERRDRDLAVGLGDVAAVLAALGDEPLDVVLDSLLGTLLSGVGLMDDVAAVAVRVGPEPRRPVRTPTDAAADDERHRLPAGPMAPAVARHHVNRFVDGLPATLVEDARVLVSELAGNAVRHAAAPFELRLRRADGGVQIGVRDAGPTLLARTVARPTVDKTSGRGPVIVAGLASRWWVEPAAEAGKTVWFELGPEPRGTDAGGPDIPSPAGRPGDRTVS